MREAILGCFERAGLDGAEWEPMAGDPSNTKPDWEIASPTLHVIVTTGAAMHPADAVKAMSGALAAALGDVRHKLPTLPLGLRIQASGKRFWFAFQVTDTAEAVERGLGGLPTSAELERLGAAVGWDDRARTWIAL